MCLRINLNRGTITAATTCSSLLLLILKPWLTLVMTSHKDPTTLYAVLNLEQKGTLNCNFIRLNAERLYRTAHRLLWFLQYGTAYRAQTKREKNTSLFIQRPRLSKKLDGLYTYMEWYLYGQKVR